MGHTCFHKMIHNPFVLSFFCLVVLFVGGVVINVVFVDVVVW